MIRHYTILSLMRRHPALHPAAAIARHAAAAALKMKEASHD